MNEYRETLKFMRKMLVDAEIGMGFLEAIGQKYKIGEHRPMDHETTMRFTSEVRELFRTLGFETSAMLIQAMTLAGDPMLARLLGIQLSRPAHTTQEKGN